MSWNMSVPPDGWWFYRVEITTTTTNTTSTALPDPHAGDFAAWEDECGEDV